MSGKGGNVIKNIGHLGETNNELPSDERIQILQESCKLLASSMHSLPRLLARFLQDFEFVDH